jgi:dihydrolipoamide dehydrogenase
MAGYDVLVLGGGPAGYTAALKAAELGARVALIEPERPGGACVHHACIPTNVMLDAALTHLDARELAVHGVFSAGDTFSLPRAAARKDALVRMIEDGIRTALKLRKVDLVEGRGAFRDPHSIEVTGPNGLRTLAADAFVIATGTRWEPPSIPGITLDRVLTADGVQSLAQAPASALVLGGGPAETAFALEYATLLAIAGSTVTLATPHASLVPALDADVANAAAAMLGDLGITVTTGAEVDSGDTTGALLRTSAGETRVEAAVVVAADVRRPFFGALNLPAAGVETIDRIPVGRDCRTNVPHIFAAGDVTGGIMLTNAAQHMGEVAGANAAGDRRATRLSHLPYVLHAAPEIAWVGQTEAAAREEGHEVRTGIADLSFNPRAIALGARPGLVKVVVEADLGEILGVHVAGPGASEIVAVASALMQAEVPADALAALVAWHPSMTESLVEATRRALA